ncbi:glycosyltransferase family 2 protein [candidate division KSB1 bacterium]|nr:glycosyltransferase family 2 protein [candidate division KSB1 bacterium]
MNKINDVLILIPVFNEADNIEKLVFELSKYIDNHNIVVMNDGSTDSTGNIIRKLSVHIIEHAHNMGKGAALLTGLKYAKKAGYKWVITLDGDGQHQPRYISDFLRQIRNNKVDLLLGNRQNRTNRMPLHRILSNGITSIIVSLCAGNIRIHDSQCGYRAFRLDCIDPDIFSEQGFQFESEMILRLGKCRCKIKEIPIETKYGNEFSSINLFGDTFRFIKLVFRSFTW